MLLLLADHDVADALEWEPEQVPDRVAAHRKVAKACSLIVRGLGDVPLSAVIRYSDSAALMWDALNKRYASETTFSKAQVFAQIMRKQYNGQKMDAYVSEWEMLTAKLASIGEGIDETMLVTMFFESFGAGQHKEYGAVITALQTKDDVSWEDATTRMLQEYSSRQAKHRPKRNEQALATDYGGRGRGSGSRYRGRGRGRYQGGSPRQVKVKEDDANIECWYCGKPGCRVPQCHWFQEDSRKRKKQLAEEQAEEAQMTRRSSDESEVKFTDDSSYSYLPKTERRSRDHAILDSGATSHMLKDDSLMIHKNESSARINTASNKSLTAESRGSAPIHLGKGMARMQLKDVLYVPEITANLLSIAKLCDAGFKILFTKERCNVYKKRSLIGYGYRSGDHYIADMIRADGESAKMADSGNSAAQRKAVDIWHIRLGHVNKETLKKMAECNAVDGLSLDSAPKLDEIQCEPCAEGKMTNTFMRYRTKLSTTPGEVVHTDVCYMNKLSKGGARYFVTFTDEATGYVRALPIKSKGQASSRLLEHVKWIERQSGNRVKRVRLDGGNEYDQAAEQLRALGIDILMNAPYTPNENGRAERQNRTLLDMIRTMLIEAALPAEFWGEALALAVSIRNMVLKKGKKVSPQEELIGVKPSAVPLRPFGCQVMIRVPEDVRRKLDDKAVSGILMRHISYGKYRVYLPEEDRFTTSRHCQIDETRFPAREWSEAKRIEFEDEDDPNAEVPSDSEEDDPDRGAVKSGDSRNEEGSNQEEKNDEIEPPHRYPSRTRRQPGDWWVTGEAAQIASDASTDPETYEEAMASADADKWKEALAIELAQIEAHGTWTPCEVPRDRKALTTKFVFKKKLNSAGEVARYKVRLVVHGYKQKFGVDYGETYAPVVDYDVALSILSSYAARGAEIHQVDFVTAFLNGDIEEEVYVQLPAEYDKRGNTYKLEKSLYGLKQSPRNWHMKLCSILRDLGFTELKSADCVFRKGEGMDAVIVMAYVDDLLITSENAAMIAKTKRELGMKFPVTDLGELKYFLGIKFERSSDRKQIKLTQSSYIDQVTARFNMTAAKPAPTPMISDFGSRSSSLEHQSEEERKHMESVPYRELLGCLLYLSRRTRPDISFAVGVLCRAANNPTAQHWEAAKRVVRYLAGTKNEGITIGLHGTRRQNGMDVLTAYSDADWAGDMKDRVSTTGYVLFLNGAPIAWCTQKQKCTALSSTEAEYIALAECVKTVVRTRRILEEVGSTLYPTTIFEDNQSCISWVYNSGKRSKHVDVRYHYSKSIANQGSVNIKYCPTASMVADMFTKPLGPLMFRGQYDRLHSKYLRSDVEEESWTTTSTTAKETLSQYTSV